MSCRIRFVLELHDPDDVQLNNHNPPRVCNAKAQQEAYDQACRQKLRALLLVVKAKLEAVAAGISTLETGFLANIVLPDNNTAGDWMLPQIDQAYRTCCPLRDGSGTVPSVPFPSRRPEWFTRSWNGNVPVGLWQRLAGWGPWAGWAILPQVVRHGSQSLQDDDPIAVFCLVLVIDSEVCQSPYAANCFRSTWVHRNHTGQHVLMGWTS